MTATWPPTARSWCGDRYPPQRYPRTGPPVHGGLPRRDPTRGNQRRLPRGLLLCGHGRADLGLVRVRPSDLRHAQSNVRRGFHGRPAVGAATLTRTQSAPEPVGSGAAVMAGEWTCTISGPGCQQENSKPWPRHATTPPPEGRGVVRARHKGQHTSPQPPDSAGLRDQPCHDCGSWILPFTGSAIRSCFAEGSFTVRQLPGPPALPSPQAFRVSAELAATYCYSLPLRQLGYRRYPLLGFCSDLTLPMGQVAARRRSDSTVTGRPCRPVETVPAGRSASPT